MTKKDYELIAKALWATAPSDRTRSRLYMQWQADVHGIAEVLGNADPKFKYIKFVRACGYIPAVSVGVEDEL